MKMNYAEKIQSRQEYNIKTLELLLKVVKDKKNKDIRLGQLLSWMDTCMHNEFYEEPVDMYDRYVSSLKRLKMIK